MPAWKRFPVIFQPTIELIIEEGVDRFGVASRCVDVVFLVRVDGVGVRSDTNLFRGADVADEDVDTANRDDCTASWITSSGLLVESSLLKVRLPN
jgi:hypothetical protein